MCMYCMCIIFVYMCVAYSDKVQWWQKSLFLRVLEEDLRCLFLLRMLLFSQEDVSPSLSHLLILAHTHKHTHMLNLFPLNTFVCVCASVCVSVCEFPSVVPQ